MQTEREDGVGTKGGGGGGGVLMQTRGGSTMEAGEIQQSKTESSHRNYRKAAQTETSDEHKRNGTTGESSGTRLLPLLEFQGY